MQQNSANEDHRTSDNRADRVGVSVRPLSILDPLAAGNEVNSQQERLTRLTPGRIDLAQFSSSQHNLDAGFLVRPVDRHSLVGPSSRSVPVVVRYVCQLYT